MSAHIISASSRWSLLEAQVQNNHQRNLESGIYSPDECESVRTRSPYLLPGGFELRERETELLRALCVFSQTELRPAHQITSHRPVIGRLIVFLKKLTWPLVQVHLKDTFQALREFHSFSVVLFAQQLVEIEELKKRLPQ